LSPDPRADAGLIAVTPHSLRHVLLPTLGLTAVLVLAARPLAAFVSTLRTDLARGERAFIGWMAPRGIVAAATASTFGAGLVAKGIGGASQILPATFVVIVATVTLYGVTAVPVARRAGRHPPGPHAAAPRRRRSVGDRPRASAPVRVLRC
jgi:NhaP-type Na+/H+ or K+/H+ antiporter